jgi:hypothetical protein
MDFSGIKQKIENIEYSWKNPQMLLVLIPGVSLVIQKIQLTNVLPLMNNPTQQNVAQANVQTRKFLNVCKWHLGGAIIQAIVTATALASISTINTFAILLLSSLTLLAVSQMIYTIIKDIKNPATIYEFNPNGTVKKMTTQSACSFFA